MKPYPMLMVPILKHRVWGGRELARLGKTLPEGAVIGESWEIADLPDRIEGGRSAIANGPLAGWTLRDALREHGTLIMGQARLTDDGGFPLLIKYLDARENLSVQVHPTPGYAAAHPGADPKTEAWFVVRADPGATIYRGIRPGVTPGLFAEHAHSGEVVEDLVAIPARAGDFLYLPSGTCHALGKGLVVAEIQTPSDTTFRVYDWGRSGRALHLEEAMACIDFEAGAPEETLRSPPPLEVDGLRTTPLVSDAHFEIEAIEAAAETRLPVVTNGVPVILLVVAGTARLDGAGLDVAVRTGGTVMIPAAETDAAAHLDAGTTMLRVTPPSPVRGLLA